jgi:acyl-coenzyme A synthetase/AMP-(fatty) acid ligase
MAGSLHNEEATEAALPHGWFHSGDVGWFGDHGVLWFADRHKDVIKTGPGGSGPPLGHCSGLPTRTTIRPLVDWRL